MLEKFATRAPVTRFLTVQCEYSRRICNKRLFSKQLPINVAEVDFDVRHPVCVQPALSSGL